MAKAKFARFHSAEPNEADVSGAFQALLQQTLLLALKEQQVITEDQYRTAEHLLKKECFE